MDTGQLEHKICQFSKLFVTSIGALRFKNSVRYIPQEAYCGTAKEARGLPP